MQDSMHAFIKEAVVETEVLTAIIGAGAGVGGVLLGAIFGAWLNRRSAIATARQLIPIEQQRLTSQRLWESRREAYTEILKHLQEARRAAERIEDELNDPQGNPHDFYGSKRHRDIGALRGEGYRAAQRGMIDHQLSISRAFRARYETFLMEVEAVDDAPPNMDLELAAVYRSATRDLFEIATTEIFPEREA